VIGALLVMISAACAVGDEPPGEVTMPTDDGGESTLTGADEAEETGDEQAAAGETPARADEGEDTGDTAVAAGGDPGDCAADGEGSIDFELDAAGHTYQVRMYRPSLVQGRAPVVINWHGLGSTGVQQALLTSYEQLARSEGFIVVHPTGTSGGGGARSWELDQFDEPERDDVAMAGALIDRLVAEYCVDERRVYSTGMSNGGFFTSRLVCEMSDRIAAAVSVAGVSHYEDCRPMRPVPFLAYHGTADEIVPYDGGPSPLATAGSSPATVEFFNQVMPDEFAEFAADFGCEPRPIIAEVTDEVVRHDYQSCDDDVELAFVEIVEGGHTWPGSLLAVLAGDALGRTTTDVSATLDGWRFMSRYALE